MVGLPQLSNEATPIVVQYIWVFNSYKPVESLDWNSKLVVEVYCARVDCHEREGVYVLHHVGGFVALVRLEQYASAETFLYLVLLE